MLGWLSGFGFGHLDGGLALCKVLCHNLYVLVRVMHELGVEAAF